MDSTLLRIILLIAGVVLLAGIYFWGRARFGRSRRIPPRRGYPDFSSITGKRPAEQPDGSDVDEVPAAFAGDAVHEMADDPAAIREELDRMSKLIGETEDSEPLLQEAQVSDTGKLPDEQPADSGAPPLVVALTVVALEGHMFHGTDVRAAAEAARLYHGDMQVYHRHLGSPDNSPSVFSMVNMIEPGTFQADAMDDMDTPGIALIMGVPGPADSLKVFSDMVATGRTLASKLNGKLCDQGRSALTRQRIDHIREEIIGWGHNQDAPAGHA